MKRIFSFIAACATMFALAACQEELPTQVEPEVQPEFVGEEYQTVTFTVDVPQEAQTKAISDGLSATELEYAVYHAGTYTDAEGNVVFEPGDYIPGLSQGKNADIKKTDDRTWQVTLTLAKNVKYDIVFWAYAPNAPYEFDEENAQIKVTDNYAGVANAEVRDAFFARCDEYAVVTTDTKISLHRPFAQINFGSDDYVPYVTDLGLDMTSKIDTKAHEKIEASEFEAERPAVASTMLPTILNVLDGTVSGEAEVDFELAQIPYETSTDNQVLLEVDNGSGEKVKYYWMSMNYVLAAEESTIDNIRATFHYNNQDLTIDVPSVPYKRNYKTNILGTLFTGPARFNVVIVPDYYTPDMIINLWDGHSVAQPANEGNEWYVTTGAELAWVAQEVNSGNRTFEGEVVYVASDIRLANYAWTPIGTDEHPFKGTFEALAVTSMLSTKSADGEYYSISGLNVNYKQGPAGLFGVISDAEIINVTLDNPVVKGAAYVGAVVGKIHPDGLVEGVTVLNGTVAGNHYVGGVVGYAYGSVKGCTVDGTSVTGTSVDEDLDGDKIGGILGFHPVDADGTEVSGNVVVDLTISGKRDVGAVVGAANAENVKENEVQKAAIVAEPGQSTVGVIAGRTFDDEGNEVTIDPKANDYDHTQITVNGEQAAPAKYFDLEYVAESIPAEGGEFTVKIVSNVSAWTVTAPEGVTVEPAEGAGEAEVVFTFPENTVAETLVHELVFTNKDNSCAVIDCTVMVAQEAAAGVFNVEALTEAAVPAEGGEYKVKVTGNAPWTATVPEGVTAVPAEGVGEAEVVFTVPANANTEATSYEVSVATTCEVEQSVFEFTIEQEAYVPEFVEATVAEFLAAAEDETVYQLSGTITSVTNTTFGNFYLKDATGEVYVYGLCSPEGVQKYWAESGAKLGDKITVQTVRASYNGAPQGKDAIFVELVPFVAEASEWGIIGDLTSWADGSDIPMYTTREAENLFVAYNVEITEGGFKVRANKEWNDDKNYGLENGGSLYADKYYSVITSGGSQNICLVDYGTYDVYFDLTNKRVALMTPGKEYAEAEDGVKPVVIVEGLKDHEWGIAGSFQGWNATNPTVTEVEGDWVVAKNVTLSNGDEFKFVADNSWDLSYGSGCDVNVGSTYTTYKDGGNMKFVGEAGAYNVYFSLLTAECYIEEYVEAPASATITFDDVAKRTSFSTSEQVWEENGITVTNSKGSSTSNVADYTKPARFYKSSSLKVAATTAEMTSIIFTCNNASYATALSSSIGEAATVEGNNVTVTLATPAYEYEISSLTGGQVRMDSVTVNF